MQEIARQLEQVRRRGRALLLVQRLSQALAAVLVVLVVLGAIDFGLRLPGWLRGMVVLGLVIWGGCWLIGKLSRAWGFWPTLSALALRLEQQHPRLTGLLSSALDFGLYPEKVAQPTTTAAMAAATVQQAQQALTGVRVTQLIDLRPTRQRVMWLFGALLLTAGLVALAPTYSAIAASRWLMPWSDAAWPKRTQIDAAALAKVWPIDTPIEFTATVSRGFRPGMRVWVNTRWVNTASEANASPESSTKHAQENEIQTLLMTEQLVLSSGKKKPETLGNPEAAAGNNPEGSDGGSSEDNSGGGGFVLQWRPGAEVIRRVSSGQAERATLEVWFTAGDDRTETQTVNLVARPALTSAMAEVQPPAYAVGLVANQRVALHEQATRVAALPMLPGSRVSLALVINKKLPIASLRPEAIVPGLASLKTLKISSTTTANPEAITLSFTLDETRETTLALTDQYGLSNEVDRLIRFEKTEDQQPTVVLIEPSADLSVLATAILPVVARVSDDVGVRRLVVDVVRPKRANASSEGGPGELPDATQTTVLIEREARQAELTADAVLDLKTMNLRPGDVVVIGAHGSDVYEHLGLRHDVVDATPRRLRIIDAAALISQLRSDLAGVRQQAVRLERQQAELNRRVGDHPAALSAEQNRMTHSLKTQTAQLQKISDRLELNRLDEPTLEQLIRQADQLVSQASRSSDAAQQNLAQAAQQQTQDPAAADESKQAAAAQQQAVQEKLAELSRLLDQGQDALGLKLELARLRTEQQALSADTRALLPRTAGQAAENLSEELQQALRGLADRQKALAEQSQDAIEQLQSTAESLAKQEESDADRAAAEALAEAAAVAQRQGLSQQMNQSQQGLEQNQLSQASQSQMQSLDTLDQMIQQLGEQDKLKQELLRRRLLALEEKLRRLIEAQTVAASALEKRADEKHPGAGEVVPGSLPGSLPGLLPGPLPGAEVQSKLWVRTIAVQTQAEANEQTAEVAPIVGQAVDAQAVALAALRNSARAEALAAKRVAIERLEEALAKVQEKQAENEQDQAKEKREKLREKYLALAEKQHLLRSEVEVLLADFPVTRRTRVALRGAGKSQGEVQREAEVLGQEVDGTVVFRQMHQMIDRVAARAADPLSRGEDDGRVLPSQAKVAVLLETMAEALDESGGPKEFSDGGGGGGGGGGAGQPPPLIPPAAEVKLLRGVQQAVYNETRELSAAVRNQPTPRQATQLNDLAEQQRELSGMGQRLIEKMKQANTLEQSQTIQPASPSGTQEPEQASDGPEASENIEPLEGPHGSDLFESPETSGAGTEE